MRIIRLIRVLRVLKLARYSRALQAFGVVMKEKREELALIALFLGVLLVMASASMYFVENEAQPGVFASIPDAMWWGEAARGGDRAERDRVLRAAGGGAVAAFAARLESLSAPA